jgi:hypothetical protein
MSDPAPDAAAEAGAAAPPPEAGEAPRVVWDDAAMVSSYANVVNVLSTREEMAVLFGTNQSWNAAETRQVTVRLDNRVVLSPYAAKRLMLLLANRVQDYEARYGALNL